MSEETKQCVACAEVIKQEALLCRYCGTTQEEFVRHASKTSPTAEAGTSDLPLPVRGFVRDALQSSWLVATGVVSFAFVDFQRDGIYGPWQPVGVFAGGVFATSLLVLIVTGLMVLFSSNESKATRALRRGALAWVSVSLLIFILAFFVGNAYYERTQIAGISSQLVSSEF